MSDKTPSSESGRTQKRTQSMAEFLQNDNDQASATERGVALTILNSHYPIDVDLNLIDPNPPHEIETRMVRAQIGTFFSGILDDTWEVSEYPDRRTWRMKNVRWTISELLGSHQIGEKLTDVDKIKLTEGFNQKKPFQIGVAAGVFQQQNPTAAAKYIIGKNESRGILEAGTILHRIHDRLILPNTEMSLDDKEFFRLLLVDPDTNPTIEIALDEDEVFQELSAEYPKKIKQIQISIREGIQKWVNWAMTSTRMKAKTGEQIDELGKEIIPFFSSRGKKIASGKIRQGKIRAIKDSIKSRSSPLSAAALNREIISQLEALNKQE